MTEVQNFLRLGGTLADLESVLHIKARRHGEHPNLVLLKYDQIHSPMSDPIVQECRGIIIDEADNWNIVSRGFDKFFNYGEGLAAQLDWGTARVQEKVDGSLCVVYPYAGRWHVATTGSPDASGDVHGSGVIFRDLFWKVLGNYGNPFGTALDATKCTMCFFFELMTPMNRVVVPHSEEKLVLLGARSLFNQVELHSSGVAESMDIWGCTVPAVKEFPLSSFEDIQATFASMSPLQQEGYVVVDAGFNRVKVKHPGYVALHHAKDGLTQKAFVDIARMGETPEVMAAFPEFKPLLLDAQERLGNLVAELETAYEAISGIELQKDFAKEALKTRCSGALFALRAKKAKSIGGFLRDMRLENLMELLGYK